jgi:hypothetical protein
VRTQAWRGGRRAHVPQLQPPPPPCTLCACPAASSLTTAAPAAAGCRQVLDGLQNLAYAVAAPIEVAVLLVLSCQLVGVVAGLAGLIPMAVFVPINLYLLYASGAHQVRGQGPVARRLSSAGHLRLRRLPAMAGPAGRCSLLCAKLVLGSTEARTRGAAPAG